MGKKILITGVAIGCAATLGVGLPWLIRARNTVARDALVNNLTMIDAARRSLHATDSCINALRLIDSAKQQWALEKSITNRAPTWENIIPYVGRGDSNTMPVCPKGGTYTIGDMTTLPSCSVSEHKLVP